MLVDEDKDRNGWQE